MSFRRILLTILLLILFTNFKIVGYDYHLPPPIYEYNNNNYSKRVPFEDIEHYNDGTVVVYGNNGNGNGNDKELKDALKAFDKWIKAGNSGTFDYFLTNVYYNTPIGDYWSVLLALAILYLLFKFNKNEKR